MSFLIRDITDRVGDHRAVFYCRMISKLLEPIRPETRESRIVPYIGPTATMPSELDAIFVGGVAFLKDEDKFMLGAVKASHSARAFVPHA